jgi:hypothetical protein
MTTSRGLSGDDGPIDHKDVDFILGHDPRESYRDEFGSRIHFVS